jgi:hypothetical protein
MLNYYLTDKDPNYTIKGSRDPLGFQVIWQSAGRRLIPNLSTVSANIHDFQIICLAHALKNDLRIDNKDFEPFFIRFEQMMAYTRYKSNPKEGFNGVDKVKKTMVTKPATVRISTAPADQIMSNQKAYGIWGKYIRPFSDMRIAETQEFQDIYLPKISDNNAFIHQATLLNKKKETQPCQVEVDRLDDWSDLLKKPGSLEKKMFVDHLLKDTCGTELLPLFNNNPGWRELSFYELTDLLANSSNNPNFKAIIKFIVNTEKVLSPLNRIFRYLQTKSFWTRKEIEENIYIKTWRTTPEVLGFDETSRSLAALLALNNFDLIKGLIKRNEEVAGWRNSAAWMQITDKGIDVNHFEGAFYEKEYVPEFHNDFNYFLSTYMSLHKQLN